MLFCCLAGCPKQDDPEPKTLHVAPSSPKQESQISHQSDEAALVRAAIERGRTRVWGPIGTNYDIPEDAKRAIIQAPDEAIILLEADLYASDRYRRANAYDYLRRIFIGQDRDISRATRIVLVARSQEKDAWVRALADIVAIEGQNKLAKLSIQ